MKKFSLLKLTALLALAAFCRPAHAHDHMPASATSSDPGATLQYDPFATDYTTNSGFVFTTTQGTTNDPYLGYYYSDDQVFIALAATGDNGGPEVGHAAPGTFIQVKLLSVEGPSGASFGFWETLGQGPDGEGIDGTNLTWSVPVPYHNGTNLIYVSQSDGSPGSDPYGHIHGRVYSVTKPGLYTATWQFVDTSTNGPGGGPVDLPSAPFATYYQADLTIAGIAPSPNGINLKFATPSNQPDDLSTPPWNYFLQSSPSLGSDANWQQVGDTIVGDNTLHNLTLANSGSNQFFRLATDGGN
jgi:hypothetical protein